jgi:hypothetical protein
LVGRPHPHSQNKDNAILREAGIVERTDDTDKAIELGSHGTAICGHKLMGHDETYCLSQLHSPFPLMSAYIRVLQQRAASSQSMPVELEPDSPLLAKPSVRKYRTISFAELPEWAKCNEYILTGYRE